MAPRTCYTKINGISNNKTICLKLFIFKPKHKTHRGLICNACLNVMENPSALIVLHGKYL